MSAHLLAPLSIDVRSAVIQIFETWGINRITMQNVQKVLFLDVLASSVASVFIFFFCKFFRGMLKELGACMLALIHSFTIININ